MLSQLLVVLATAAVILISIALRPSPKPKAPLTYSEPAPYIKDLADKLPGSVLLPQDTEAFQKTLDGYWAERNREIIPACIVQPRDARELSIAVAHLKEEHAARAKQGQSQSLFTIRGGGANPALAGVKDGVVLSLSLLNEVTPLEDGKSVVVGAGAYWHQVYRELEKHGLGVVGGRAFPVGVGGSTLQGGISFYSPEHGFICSNVLSYEVVLADGSIVTASETEHADLWRALKGGANNFGVVSRFTLKAFPAGKIWAGAYIAPGFQAIQTFKAMHEHVKYASDPKTFDKRASLPILSLSYIPSVGISILHNHLAYTEPTADNGWPEYWKKSPFYGLWRFRNLFKNQDLHSAVSYFDEICQPGWRNVYGTTTITNDLDTIMAVYQIFREHTKRTRYVKKGEFIIITQPILPEWVNKGQPNVLGLEDCKEPLIIVSFSATWRRPEDDQNMEETVRSAITAIEKMAAANKTSHPYRFTNYATEWQRPQEGYGIKNLEFLRAVSKKYDPESLFQTGRVGGFKLD